MLESKLKRMDLEDWHKRDEPEDDQPMDQVPWRLTTRHRREPEEQERRARLLRDLETKFKEYGKLSCCCLTPGPAIYTDCKSQPTSCAV